MFTARRTAARDAGTRRARGPGTRQAPDAETRRRATRKNRVAGAPSGADTAESSIPTRRLPMPTPSRIPVDELPGERADATAARHYELVARALQHLREHAAEQPSLQALAQAVQTSPAHLQRVFSQWAGVSPKRFLQHLSRQAVQQRLRRGDDLLGAAMHAGLSGTGRLHDLLVSCEGVTPGELKSGGEGVALGFGVGPTPFGPARVAWTPRGVCRLSFGEDGEGRDHEAPFEDALQHDWPRARLLRDDCRARELLAKVFAQTPQRGTLHLVLRGTNFQIQVWQALLRTRPGDILTYSGLAQALGRPKAQRAVGSALAANVVGYLIPCHRVIRESGDAGHYRWGDTRKLAMLGREAAATTPIQAQEEEDAPRSSQRSTTA